MSTTEEEANSDHIFWPPHHEKEIKLIDEHFLVYVGGLSTAITSNKIAYEQCLFDKYTLEESFLRINRGIKSNNRTLPTLVLQRRPIGLIDGDEIVIVDGLRRADQLFESGIPLVPVIAVDVRDAWGLGVLIDIRRTPDAIDSSFLEPTSQHVRAVSDNAIAVGDLVAIPLPHAGRTGRKAREDGQVILFFTYIYLYQKAIEALKLETKNKITTIDYIENVRELRFKIDDYEYKPYITIQPSSIFMSMKNTKEKIDNMPNEFKVRRDQITERINKMNSDELKSNFVIASRLSARADELFEFGRKIRRANDQIRDKNRYTEKEVSGKEFIVDTMIDPARMTEFSRLTGENISTYYAGSERFFELCEWYRNIDSIIKDKNGSLISRYMACEFRWWVEAYQKMKIDKLDDYSKSISANWVKLFHIIITEGPNFDPAGRDGAKLLNEIIAVCENILRIEM